MRAPVKTLLLAGIALLCAAAPPAAQEFHYGDAWGSAGLSLTESAADGVELVFSLEDWSLQSVDVEGRRQLQPNLPGSLLPNEAGAPNLPGISRFLALPEGALPRLTILASRVETIAGVEIAPAPRIPLETEPGLTYERDPAIYGTDAYYPTAIAELSTVRQLRGVDAVIVAIHPFQYNPVTRELRVYRDLRVEVDFLGGRGGFGEERLRSRHWDPLLRNALLNADQLPARQTGALLPSRETGFEYVIITPNDPAFLAWADTLRTWRTEQGISTGVFTTTEIGGNTTAAIEGFLNTAYSTWDIPPAAFLLLGDYGTTGATIVSPVWASYCISDNIYADVDGDDLPDMAHARITARNAAELETMIGKMLAYERRPPSNPGFYQNPIIAGGWQYERWFILCSEIVFGYLANVHGMTPVREYALVAGESPPGTSWSSATNTTQVVNYFGPNGLGYIPATPSHLTDWGSNATRINADVNAGAFMLHHRDHGAENGWGEPYYVSSHLSGLQNEDLTFVFSINCLTGKYNYSSDCFTEIFHRHAQGALGLIAASEISYSFVNDVYIFGMHDCFWPDFDPGYGQPGQHDLKPAFGNAAGKYYLEVSGWPYNTQNKVHTDHLFHHHGDAFMTVFSDLPQAMAVAHDAQLFAGVGAFTVTAEPGALIGLSVAGELVGTGVGSGMPEAIAIAPQLPGQDLIVTVTRQNRLRYRQAVPIIPAAGPYLIFAGVAVEDAGGDADGELDYGEAAGLVLTLRNVGTEAATGVTATLTSGDPYLTLAGDPLGFPTIPAGGQAASLTACSLLVAGDAPDGHDADIGVQIGGDGGAWDAAFSLTLQAPALALAGLTVDDGPPGGDGDGILEAGESVELGVSVTNTGHASTAALAGLLASADPNAVVTAPAGSGPAIPVGGTGLLATFGVELLATCPEPGYVDLALEVADLAGFTAALPLELSIGGWYDDCEADRGWTIGAPDDDAAMGQWVRVDPVGTTYNEHVIQPEDDHSDAPGTLCFVTGNGVPGGAAGSEDVDGGKTTLLSPVFDLSQAASATLSYWRWYTNAWGNNPDSDYWDVDVTNDGLNWVSLEHTLDSAEAWTFMSFDLAQHIAFTDHVQIRFVAADEGSGSLVEAGVDDFLMSIVNADLTDAPPAATPARLALAANHPNPFNPSTTIAFSVPDAGRVTLAVYAINGRKLATLVDGPLSAGSHEAIWLGRDDQGRPVASGVYLYRLQTGGQSLCRKMLLVK